MALEVALRAGVTWGEFWALTPYATRKIIDAWSAEREAGLELGMLTAYQTAALGRTDRFPRTFSDWFKKPQTKPTRNQSDHEMWANFKLFASGGKKR